MGGIFVVELLGNKTTPVFFVQKQGHLGHLGFTLWDLHSGGWGISSLKLNYWDLRCGK